MTSESAKAASIPCVVLAGGRSRPDLEQMTGQSNRALVVVNGKTLLDHVVDALDGAEAAGPIAVVGDLPESPRYTRVPDQGDFVSNLFAGLALFPDAPFVLVSTSDLPFLTGAIVNDFLVHAADRAAKDGAGLVWPIVTLESCYTRFPGVKRTSLRMRDGVITGGNLMLVRPAFIAARKERIAQAYVTRKSMPRMAAMLGIGTIGLLLLSQKVSPRFLSVAILEERIGLLMGGRVSALFCDHPELATDLDRPSDFAALGVAPPAVASPGGIHG